MSVGYGDFLTHRPVKFVARRSDIIVSSTLSITLTPADSQYRPLDKALLSPEQLAVWCHKRCQYRGMNVEVADLNFDHIHAKFEALNVKKSTLVTRPSQLSFSRQSMRPQSEDQADIQKLRSVKDSEAKFNF